MSDKDVADIRKLIPRRDLVEAWKSLEDDAKELAKRLGGKEAATPSRAWHLLSEAPPGIILFTELTTRQQAVAQKIGNFFGKWRQLKQKLPLPEMAELRITPALPEYPKIAEEAFMLMLDGKLRSRTEILRFLKPYEPPPPPPPPAPPKRGRAAKAEAAAAGAAAGAVVPGKRGRKTKGAPAVPAVARKVEEPVEKPAPPPPPKAAPARPMAKAPAKKTVAKKPKKPAKAAKKAAPAKKKGKKKR